MAARWGLFLLFSSRPTSVLAFSLSPMATLVPLVTTVSKGNYAKDEPSRPIEDADNYPFEYELRDGSAGNFDECVQCHCDAL
jgi:hypothetical protein